MATVSTEPIRAADLETIGPLIELCKAGRLFEVQAWIASGKPVNMPPPPAKGTRPRSPLDYAIERGFHSLVQVLLQAGALQEPQGYRSPMEKALAARRFDIAQLLVEHGFDPKAVDMQQVFETWDPQIMEYFIDRGSDVHTGYPFARALCKRIRTALGVYKKYRARDESLQEQADIALRHHCYEGNLKWVSLMLWAGADPFTEGTDDPDEPLDEDERGPSALELAAIAERFEVFELKPIRSRLRGPLATKLLGRLVQGKGLEIMEQLLAKGLDPNDPALGSCPAIARCIERMSWWGYGSGSGNAGISWDRDRRSIKVDTNATREIMKAIHLLAKHGGKWRPGDKREIQSARRSFLQLTPDYVVEFVWIMWKYGGCARDSVLELLRTPSVRSHVSDHRVRLDELLSAWPEHSQSDVSSACS